MRQRFTLVICTFALAFCFSASTAAEQATYVGINPKNSQFERGRPFLPLDVFGDFLSKIPQLLFWNKDYGNHRISVETEQIIADFVAYYQISDLKVRINQWAPHKEIGRLIVNDQMAWPYKILNFPSTLIVSLIGRPLSGLIISDYYDPGSNTVHIFSNNPAIGLHETGHALDFMRQRYKGTYSLARLFPGVNLFQEAVATEEAMLYLEQTKQYDALLKSYKILYPAYATYISSYIPLGTPGMIGAVILGHWVGRSAAADKKWKLETEKDISIGRGL